MFILVLGTLLLLAGVFVSNAGYRIARYARTLKIAGSAMALLGLIAASVRQIDAGTIGVQSLFGKVNPRVTASIRKHQGSERAGCVSQCKNRRYSRERKYAAALDRQVISLK